jgi:NADPH:quinone reductase-like Zn-dependent oxidoreductase
MPTTRSDASGLMRAAVRDRYGPPAVVRVEAVPTPSATGDQVLVRVQAASVNRVDLDNLYPRWVAIRLFVGIRRPRQRGVGVDAAGIVEAVGPKATRFKAGDRVFADLFPYGGGAFAEFVCASEKAWLTIPDGISFADAATLPHSAVLAIQGLRSGKRRVGPGDRLLILGASGNVGPFAVQLAKQAGAVVIGTCRTSKVDFVRSLGVDEVIDYTTTDALAEAGSYDWILDVDGNTTLIRARRALRPGGVYVTFGGTGWRIVKALLLGPLLSQVSGGRRLGLQLGWKPFAPDDVATLMAMVGAGTLKPAIDRTYPLADVVEALRHLDEGRSRGKVLVIPTADGR